MASASVEKLEKEETTMAKYGQLIADDGGDFWLYPAKCVSGTSPHDPAHGDCDIEIGQEVVSGFEPTNAFGPAAVRAGRAGYADIFGEW